MNVYRKKALRYLRFWLFICGYEAIKDLKPDDGDYQSKSLKALKSAYIHVLQSALERGFVLECYTLAEHWGIELYEGNRENGQ